MLIILLSGCKAEQTYEHKHTYLKTHTVKATCEDDGYTIYRCDCGDYYEDNYLHALGHKHKKENCDPTCTDDGYEQEKCYICDKTINYTTIEKLGHKCEKIVCSATCTEDGYEQEKCSLCNEIVSHTTIPTIGHKYEKITCAATCTKTGYEEQKCSICGDVINHTTISKTKHNASDWFVAKKPTVINNGEKQRKCTICGCVMETQVYSYQTLITQEIKKRNNMAGRYSIPSVGVNVAIFNSSSQSCVDASDSAAYFKKRSCMVIGDHNYQGFEKIKSTYVGCYSYITTEGGTTTYICKKIGKGINNGYDLLENSGESVFSLYPNTLITYTCNEDSRHVTYVVWEKQ